MSDSRESRPSNTSTNTPGNTEDSVASKTGKSGTVPHSTATETRPVSDIAPGSQTESTKPEK